MRLGKPKFLGDKNFNHTSVAKIGIILVNLGSPNAPTTSALRPYLRQFLSDPRIIELPRYLWWFMLNCIIVPFRSPKSAKAYSSVWTDNGSPLLSISTLQQSSIAEKLADEPVVVELGMSYGKPTIKHSLRNLHDKNCRHIVVLPMYPQYAASTVGSVFDAVTAELASWRWVPQLRFISGYCHHQDYLQLLANSIRESQAIHGKPELTIFSFHGIQLAALENGDPYHCQCHRTARETAEILGLNPEDYLITFQSRFGNTPWLQPYTIEVMKQLPRKNIKNIQVICPAFSADCLETLEEIAGENKEAFKEAGGETFTYVPALNYREDHIEFLVNLLRNELGDWLDLVKQESKDTKLKQRDSNFQRVEPLARNGLKN